jgi:hypothetical protein
MWGSLSERLFILRNMSRVIAVRVPDELDRGIRAAAAIRGHDLADELRDALTRHLEAVAHGLQDDERRPTHEEVVERHAAPEGAGRLPAEEEPVHAGG